jgi:Peptidase family M23
MKRLIVLLPVLVSLQVGVPPALAWTWPVDGPVLRPFVLGDDPYAAGQHRGVDLGASAGSPVRAPSAGTVTFAGSVPGSGRSITVETADGFAVTLIHLGTYSVARGVVVGEGDAVGSVGPSGDPEVAEPYVHLGIRKLSEANGYVDPLTFLPAPAPAPPVNAPVEAAPEPASQDVPANSQAHPVPSPSPPPAKPALSEPAGRESRPPARPRSVANAHRNRRAAVPRSHRSARGVELRLPARTGLRSFEAPGARSFRVKPAAAASLEETPARRPVHWPLVAAVCLAVAGAACLVGRRRKLRDAGTADGPAAMLLQGTPATAEDADGLRLRQQDDVVLDGDLERVLLAQRESFADLDRNHDPTEIVDVADDPRFRGSSSGASGRRHSHCPIRPRCVLSRSSMRFLRGGSPALLVSNPETRCRKAEGCSV